MTEQIRYFLRDKILSNGFGIVQWLPQIGFQKLHPLLTSFYYEILMNNT